MKTSVAWRKKRAEVIERADGRCEHCSSKTERLNVHHRYYEAGKKDWDYPTSSLEALCQKCHGEADEMRRRMMRAIGMMSWFQDECVLAFVHARSAIAGHGPPVVQALTHAQVSGIAMAAGVPINEVQDIANTDSEGLIDVVRLCLDGWERTRR
jgi:hypothetical protein